MADVSQHGNEQPAPTVPQAAPQGQPTNAPRFLRLQHYGPKSQVRQDIMNADVLMFRGDNFVSEMIEVGTHSPYSHAGIAFRSDDVDPFRTTFGPGRVCVVEAVGAGVRMGLLSETVATYHGAVELWRLTSDGREKFDAAKAVAEARHCVGRSYGYSALLFFVLDWLTLKQFDLRSHSRKRQAVFCSQLVSMAYVRGGVDLCKRYPNAATAPADLISEGRLELIHAFTRQDPLIAVPGAAAQAGPTVAKQV